MQSIPVSAFRITSSLEQSDVSFEVGLFLAFKRVDFSAVLLAVCSGRLLTLTPSLLALLEFHSRSAMACGINAQLRSNLWRGGVLDFVDVGEKVALEMVLIQFEALHFVYARNCDALVLLRLLFVFYPRLHIRTLRKHIARSKEQPLHLKTLKRSKVSPLYRRATVSSAPFITYSQ